MRSATTSVELFFPDFDFLSSCCRPNKITFRCQVVERLHNRLLHYSTDQQGFTTLLLHQARLWERHKSSQRLHLHTNNGGGLISISIVTKRTKRRRDKERMRTAIYMESQGERDRGGLQRSSLGRPQTFTASDFKSEENFRDNYWHF